MMVEFIEQDSGNQLTVPASEFLKADKNQEEYASLAMATDAYSALYGVDYIIYREDYDAVKSWLGKTDTVIFRICEARYGHGKWCEVYILQGARLRKVIYSVDDMGREIVVEANPHQELTEKPQTAKGKVRRQSGGT